MITNVYNSGPWVTASTTVPLYINSNSPSAGMVRYHNSQLQVYDGSVWLPMSTTATVGLTGEANEIMEWGRRKMSEEREARAMSEQHPAVADALGAVHEAEQQLKTVVALCRT